MVYNIHPPFACSTNCMFPQANAKAFDFAKASQVPLKPSLFHHSVTFVQLIHHRDPTGFIRLSALGLPMCRNMKFHFVLLGDPHEPGEGTCGNICKIFIGCTHKRNIPYKGFTMGMMY